MNRFVRHVCFAATACILVISTWPTAAIAQSRPAPTRDRVTASAHEQQLDEAFRAKIRSILQPEEQTLFGARFATAHQEAESLLGQAVWYVSESNVDLFRELARSERLLRLMVDGQQTSNTAMWQMLLDHPELAETIAFTIQPGRDRLVDAMLILEMLRAQIGPDRLAQYPNLTAALAAVHDTPRPAPGRRPSTVATAPELFAYFVRNERDMAFGIKSMPVDLIAHLVDTTASIEELDWARSRYGKDRQIGNRYGEIMYDDNAFRTGTPKRIDSQPYTLQNIRNVGGVCSEQAYFAAQVGKAMGVPTIELTSAGSTTGHAWLGFLRMQGRQAAWDFDTGCYEEYKQYVGRFRDPLSGQQVEEGHAAFLSLLVGVNARSVHRAVAMHDAAAALARFGPDAESPPLTIDLPEDFIPEPIRKPDPAGISSLLMASLKETGAERRTWQLATKLAADRKIGTSEIESVFNGLERMCGRFEIGYFALIAPQLLWAVEDVRAQARLYDRLARAVRIKPGYEAGVRFLQGDDYLRRGMHSQALDAYLMPTRSRNLDGPWTLDAVNRIIRLFSETNRQQHLPEVIGDIFKRIPVPSSEAAHAARRGSVWGQVGERYYAILVATGRTQDAQALRRQLDTIIRRVDIPIPGPRRR